MGVSPAGGSDGGGEITGGGYIRLPPQEHIHTVHCVQARYRPVASVVAVSGFKGGQVVMGTVWLEFGQDADGGSGGEMDGGG